MNAKKLGLAALAALSLAAMSACGSFDLPFGLGGSGSAPQSQAAAASAPAIGSMTMEEIVAFLGLSGPPERGTTGQAISDDIAWRDAWMDLIDHAVVEMWRNPPVAATVAYSRELRQGAINFQAGTVQIFTDILIAPAPPYLEEHVRLINGLNQELIATGRNSDWNLLPLTPQNVWSGGRLELQIRGEWLHGNGTVSGRFNTFQTVTGGMITGEGTAPELTFGPTGMSVREHVMTFTGQTPIAVFESGMTARVTAFVARFNNHSQRFGPLEFPVQIVVAD
jgi:hypothetical protein